MNACLATHPATDVVADLSTMPGLPRLPAAALPALNRLHAHAPSWTLPWADGTGTIRLTPSTASRGEFDEGSRYCFRLGPHPGHVDLDAVGLRRLLREPAAEMLPHELRAVLLADALQPLCTALENATRLHFEWTLAEAPRAPAPDGACVAFMLLAHDATPIAAGTVALDEPGALDALVPDWPPQRKAAITAFENLRIPVRFELGATSIALEEVRRVTPGDIVSVERWRSREAGLLSVVKVGHRGTLGVTAAIDGAEASIVSMGEDPMNVSDITAGTSVGESNLPLGRLDALEVVLRFEVGELMLSLGELRALQPGHVFDLGEPLNRSTVRILAHGNLLGKGTLVAVGDRLGVRVAEFAAASL
jgi:type III secretion protein Q